MRRRLREIARAHPRWGWKTAHAILRREGHTINRKRTRRLWRDEGLRRPAPCKRKRTRPPGGGPLLRAERPNHVWAIDFQFDETADRRRLKLLQHRRRAHPRGARHATSGRTCTADDVVAVIERPRRRPRRARAPADGQRPRAHRLGAAGLVPPRRHRAPPTSSPARRGRTPSSRASTAASATSCSTSRSSAPSSKPRSSSRPGASSTTPTDPTRSLGGLTPAEYAERWTTNQPALP